MNSIIRFKLALTEDSPVIKPYKQEKWALLPDSESDDISASIKILEGVHLRLVTVLHTMSDTEYKKTFTHPGIDKKISLAQNTSLYAWHSQHHYAHVEQALKYHGSF